MRFVSVRRIPVSRFVTTHFVSKSFCLKSSPAFTYEARDILPLPGDELY
jgi:hypothetical protein